MIDVVWENSTQFMKIEVDRKRVVSFCADLAHFVHMRICSSRVGLIIFKCCQTEMGDFQLGLIRKSRFVSGRFCLLGSCEDSFQLLRI